MNSFIELCISVILKTVVVGRFFPLKAYGTSFGIDRGAISSKAGPKITVSSKKYKINN